VGSRKLVCFDLGGQEYAAPIEDVKETITLRPISRVFLTPPWVAGIVNLRGDVLAVLDLALMLGMSRTVPGDDSRIVVARVDGRRAGVLVDAMRELRELDLDALQPPPPTLDAAAAALMLGLATVEGGKPLRVLDLRRVLDAEGLRRYRRA
jgi:purine-binding chemotaxis protein CheW